MTTRTVYVGSRTSRERKARGEGITVFRMDTSDGSLERLQTVGDLINPSFLALHPSGRWLYTVHGDGTQVSVLRIDATTGTLEWVQRVECGARNPVHLSVDPTGCHLVVAIHLGEPGGSLVTIPIAGDGRLGDVLERVQLPGRPGPHRIEQGFSRPHFCGFDPTGRCVVVPDKGLDRIFVFRFEHGRLIPADRPWVQARENAGPRHVAFDPRARFIYAVNELDSTVMAMSFDASSGMLEPFQIQSTLEPHYTQDSRAAAIVMSSDGRSLFTSTRGSDTVTAFKVDPDTGWMHFHRSFASNGRTPRAIALDPDDRFLYVLNEDSDSIDCVALEQPGPRSPRQVAACGSPVCMVFGQGMSTRRE